MSSTTVPSGHSSHLKPDGLLVHREAQEIRVLEFKRTNDFFEDSFKRALLKKWVKYKPLADDIRQEHPDWDVQLLVFVLGDRGLLDEG